MHIHTLSSWEHSHNFVPAQTQAETRTKWVLGLTAIAMVGEIVAGTVFGSMALLADGWHMATHVAAFGITVFAYYYARTHAHDPQYTFGTGKVSVLGGFTSAIALAVVALLMVVESVTRFWNPEQIQFNEALIVAGIGLGVNLLSAVLLHDHSHAHHHADHHHPDHQHADATFPAATDHNLQAAYVHVLADALTSVLAIAALVAGKWWGWLWLDAAMGIVGAIVITRWAYGLVRETGAILLDGGVDKPIRAEIVRAIEQDADNRVVDVHVWHLSPAYLAATIALVTHHPQPPDHYKALLTEIPALAHVVVEVHPCVGEPCLK